MATATKTQPTFLRTSYTEKLMFPAKPDRSTRQALVAAGFRWNGIAWWRNHNQLLPIKPRELAELLAPAPTDAGEVTEPASATA